MNPAVRLTKYMYDRDTLHVYEGIRIFSQGPKEAAGPFVNRVVKALAIIKANDPKRFRRVQRLRYIVNMWGSTTGAVGCYNPVFRECVVDFKALEKAHKSWQTPETLAMIIVHEATHALLSDLFGEPIDIDFQMRVESICCREQARFMRKLGFKVSSKFDEATYRQNWQRTKIERVIDGCDLMSERLPPGKRRAVATGVGRVLKAVRTGVRIHPQTRPAS